MDRAIQSSVLACLLLLALPIVDAALPYSADEAGEARLDDFVCVMLCGDAQVSAERPTGHLHPLRVYVTSCQIGAQTYVPQVSLSGFHCAVGGERCNEPNPCKSMLVNSEPVAPAAEPVPLADLQVDAVCGARLYATAAGWTYADGEPLLVLCTAAAP